MRRRWNWCAIRSEKEEQRAKQELVADRANTQFAALAQASLPA
jgi:hypothetical protein